MRNTSVVAMTLRLQCLTKNAHMHHLACALGRSLNTPTCISTDLMVRSLSFNVEHAQYVVVETVPHVATGCLSRSWHLKWC